MKPIQIEKATLDIPFVDSNGKTQLVIEFDRTDENIKRLYASFEDLEKTKNELSVTEDGNVIDDAKDFIKDIMDPIFGEGTFDKVYALCPSVVAAVVHFYKMSMALKEELEMDDFKNFEEKYLS
ncbi:hypothetical protein OGZ44_06535 [Lactococcus lactis]|uniref:hypothetical protein n=1 Tax=Lactococcus lactis TaxID=1358 RepID=UPI002416E503|nr:hypothetical protein [Lactococcus lactis]MDG4973895.1 hypothetical protein [Lactococcus lactis]